MESRSSRPLRAEERRALTRLSSRRDDLANDFFATLLVFSVVFFAGTGLLRLVTGHRPQGLSLGVVATLATVVALWALVKVGHGRMGRALAQQRKHFAEDLAAGKAACTTYDVVDALKVEELEDEGASFYLALADGRVLFLSGQYLDDAVEERKFPCARFTLVRAPKSGLFLDLEAIGAPLPASGTLPAITPEDHRAERAPYDGDVLALDFETLRRKAGG
jgi:hypothetical protein